MGKFAAVSAQLPKVEQGTLSESVAVMVSWAFFQFFFFASFHSHFSFKKLTLFNFPNSLSLSLSLDFLLREIKKYSLLFFQNDPTDDLHDAPPFGHDRVRAGPAHPRLLHAEVAGPLQLAVHR